MDRSRADRVLEELDTLAMSARRPEMPARTAGTRTALPIGLVAAAVVVVVVIASLGSRFAPNAAGPGSSDSSNAAVVPPSSSPSSSPAATPGETPGSSPTAPGPSVTPGEPIATPPIGPGVPYTCSGTFHLDATSTSFEPVVLTDVRVGTHDGYDRIVFEFSGAGTPGLDLTVAAPPFVMDGSGQPVSVTGKAFLRLVLHNAAAHDTAGRSSYGGPAAFAPGYPKLVALVGAGDYEGYVTWIAGLSGAACYHVSTLTSPSRIVVDLQTP